MTTLRLITLEKRKGLRSLKSLLMTMKEEVFMLIEMEIRLRGKDMFWTKKMNFNNPREYQASNIIQELNEGYTRKRMSEFEYRTVNNYVCKFSQKTGFLPCRKEIRIIFPSDSNVGLSAEIRQALDNFFTYSRSVWVESKEHKWCSHRIFQ